MHYIIQDEDQGLTGQGEIELHINLDRINKLLPQFNGTLNTFLNAIMLFAAYNYNKQPTWILTAVDDRSPGQNIAGNRVINVPVTFTTEYDSLADVYSDLNNQMVEINKYAKFDFRSNFRLDVQKGAILVSYVGDWFEEAQHANPLGKPFDLENKYKSGVSYNTGYICHIRHEKGDMVIHFDYSLQYFKKSSAEKFVKMVEYAAEQMIEGKIPNYDNIVF